MLREKKRASKSSEECRELEGRTAEETLEELNSWKEIGEEKENWRR